MKGQLRASTPAEYLTQLEEPRKAEVTALHALIRKTAPKLEPFIQIGILAYGPCRQRYAGGREIDWFRIGVASNKSYISLYVSADCDAGNITGRYKEALPKANIGKNCVRFKHLADLDEAALRKLIREAARDAAKA